MSVDITKLGVGSLVKLASGSPKMVVTGFGPGVLPVDERRTVKVLVWCDRVGLVEAELSPEALGLPRPAPVDGLVWTAQMESARLALCQTLVELADKHGGDPVLEARLLEAEQALTRMGEIIGGR